MKTILNIRHACRRSRAASLPSVGKAATLALGLWVAMVPDGHAATGTWTGTGGEENRNWDNSANWQGAFIPGSTSGTTVDKAAFSANAPSGAILIDEGRRISDITFSGGNVFVLGELNGPVLRMTTPHLASASGQNTINAPLALITTDANIDFVTNSTVASDFLKIGGNITSESDVDFTINLTSFSQVAYGEISGNISDGTSAIKIDKREVSVWTLSGENTHSGGVDLNKGTLNLNNARALGTGIFRTTGTASMDNTSGAAITLTGYSEFQHRSNLTFIGTNDLSTGTARINLDATSTTQLTFRLINVQSGTLTYAGDLVGYGEGADPATRPGALTKSGEGTLIFTGDQTDASVGKHNITAGIIRLESDISHYKPFTVTGGVLELTAASGDIVGTLTGATTLSGYTLNGGGFSAYDADRSVNLGASLRWGQTGWDDTKNVFLLSSNQAAATITFESSINLARDARDREIRVMNGSSDVDAILSGVLSNSHADVTLSKTGEGTLKLTAANTFNNVIYVKEGRLIVGETGTINAISALELQSGAIFEYQNNTVGLTKEVRFGAGGGTFIYNSSQAYTGGSLIIADGTTLQGNGLLGEVVLQAGGTVAPGNSIGTLSLDNENFTWNGEMDAGLAQMAFELSLVNNQSDRFDLGTGTFIKGTGDYFTFDFLGTGAIGFTYTLLEFGGISGFDVSDFSFVNLGDGLTGSFLLNANNLQFEIVPEPGTISFLLIGAMGFLGLAIQRRLA